MKEETKVQSVRLPVSMLYDVERHADSIDRSSNWVVKEAVKTYLDSAMSVQADTLEPGDWFSDTQPPNFLNTDWRWKLLVKITPSDSDKYGGARYHYRTSKDGVNWIAPENWQHYYHNSMVWKIRGKYPSGYDRQTLDVYVPKILDGSK